MYLLGFNIHYSNVYSFYDNNMSNSKILIFIFRNKYKLSSMYLLGFNIH